ncbi:MAG: TraR/DksA C4-type zinc finger protein [Gemmatimonadaceae bacterium]
MPSPPTPSPLTPSQLAELRAELETELGRLRRSMRISEATAGPVALDQTAVGRLSRMDAIQSQAMQKGLHERELGRLGALESAVRRLDDGTFGFCDGCGVPIPFGRLLVMPEARHCTACSGTG